MTTMEEQKNSNILAIILRPYCEIKVLNIGPKFKILVYRKDSKSVHLNPISQEGWFVQGMLMDKLCAALSYCRQVKYDIDNSTYAD